MSSFGIAKWVLKTLDLLTLSYRYLFPRRNSTLSQIPIVTGGFRLTAKIK